MKIKRRQPSVIIGCITIGVSILAMLGWILDLHFLTTIIPGTVSIKFNTALTFLFLGIALVSLRTEKSGLITYLFSSLTALSGGFGFIEYFFGSPWGIDEFFFRDNTASFYTSSPGRMALISAICFFCLGIGLVLVRAEKKNVATPLAVMAFFFAIFSGLLYFSGLGISFELYDGLLITSVSLIAAALFIITSLALLCEIADNTHLTLLISGSAASNHFRKALFFLAAATILTHSLLEIGINLHLYSHTTYYALQNITILFNITVVLWFIASSAQTTEALLHTKEKRDKRILTEELEKNKKLFQAIYQNAEEAIILLDLITLKFLDANPAALKMFRFIHLKEFLAAKISDLSPEKQPDGTVSSDRLHELTKTVALTGSVFFPFQYQRLTGEQFPVSAHVTKVLFDNKVILQATFRDLNEEKLTEKNLHDANAKIIELAKAKNEFVSLAAHQLRSPIATILNFTDILEEDSKGLSALQKESFEYIGKSVKNLNELVSFLLKISRAEIGTLKLALETIDLKELTGEAISVLESEVSSKNQRVEMTLKPDPLPIISLDKEALKQVIVNLLSNATRYSPAGSTITVNAILKGNEIEFSVQDHGMGIPKEVQNKIFQRFFRADNAKKSVSEGTGLGLALAKSFVEAWGGRIWFISEERVGSTFFITLPANNTSNVNKPKL